MAKPLDYTGDGQYRIPVQERPESDDVSFTSNRQIRPPTESHLFIGQGALRTKRGSGTAGGGMNPWYHATIGAYCFPQYGGSGGVQTLNWALNQTVVAPLWLETAHTYDRLMMRVNAAFTGTFDVHMYYLNTDTFMPETYVGNAGTCTWTGAAANQTVTISWTPTQNLCGVGVECTAITAGTATVPTRVVALGYGWPIGLHDNGTLAINVMQPYRIQATADPAVVGNFSKVVVTTGARFGECQPLIGVRRGA